MPMTKQAAKLHNFMEQKTKLYFFIYQLVTKCLPSF